MNDFAAFNAVYSRLLDGATPARSVVEAGALPRGAMVEIEAVACR
jgi:2-iminobutanoate/2-iminopropanoate deaminase